MGGLEDKGSIMMTGKISPEDAENWAKGCGMSHQAGACGREADTDTRVQGAWGKVSMSFLISVAATLPEPSSGLPQGEGRVGNT